MFNIKNSTKRGEKKKYLFWKKVSLYFSEFTNNTSLHGFRYIGDRERTTFERILWLIVVFTSIITCFFLLSNTYSKWVNTPIIMVEDKESRPIVSIPFPAVTICPENKINQSVYNYTSSVRNLTEEMLGIVDEKVNISSVLCENFGDEILAASSGNKTEILDTKEFLYSISPNSEGIRFCKWNSRLFDCEKVLMKSFTEDGLCYSFNTLTGDQIFAGDVVQFRDFWQHNFSVNGWSTSHGYADLKDKDTYPRRTFSSGLTSGFSVFLATLDENLDFACRNLPEGHKVILHYPAEIPRAEKLTSISMTSVLIEPGEDVSIAIIPKVTTTSESLRKYKPNERGCFYPNEKILRYFKDYSQQKCVYECIQNLTMLLCECSAYYMPMINDTPICRSSNMECLQSVKEEIASNSNSDDNICNCLPTCSSITYSAEFSSYTYNLLRRFAAFGLEMHNQNELRISRVTIYFKETQYFVNRRTELYGFTDFISDCGGLFGLFVGFSLISLIEALYFITLRIIMNCRKHGRDKWHGSDGLEENKKESINEHVE